MAEANDGAQTGAGEGGDTVEAARIEARAGALGWVPKETYEQRGKDVSTWVDAATFIKRGRDFTRNQTQTIRELQAEVESMKQTRAAFIQLQTRENKALRDRLDAAERETRRKQETARVNGDVDEALAAGDRLEAIRAEKAAAEAEAEKLATSGKPKGKTETSTTGEVVELNPEHQRIMDGWIADGNQWFQSDARMRSWAIDVGNTIKKDFPDLAPREFLDKVRQVMEADFPHKFQKAAPANKTDGGGGRGTSAGRTVADLPEADRAIMRQLVKEGYYKTEQDFLNSYFSR